MTAQRQPQTARDPSDPVDPRSAPWVTGPAARVDAFMSDLIADAELPPKLDDAVRYALLSGGKRLRPILAWNCAAAIAPDLGHTALPAGAGVELVHAFSLVHDDLPAMDDDDVRRGRPTLHVHAGEAMAILAGDAMLSIAFQAIARPAPGLEPPAPTLIQRLAAELADGTTAMIAGQVYDTLAGFPDHATDAERLETIHRKKTGALLRAACRMGAICALHAKGPEHTDTHDADELLARITTYAEATGLMFQIVDDLIDVEQSAEHTGKRTGKDLDAGKLTYPGVHGIHQSRETIEQLRLQALDAVAALGPHADPLRELCRYLAVRTN